MNHRRIHTAGALLLFLISSLYSQRFDEGLPLISNYNASRMGGGEQNWSATQDERGMLYVANEQGVLEYDGTSWRIIPVPGEGGIRSLVTGDKGIVYVGANAEFGYLAPDRTGTMQYHSLSVDINKDEQPFSYIWRCYAAGKLVYFCSTEYIFIYDSDSENLSAIQTTAKGFFSFLIDSTLYLSDFESGLFRLEGEHFVPVPGGDFFREKNISGMCRYKDQRILIGTFSSGLYLFHAETGEIDPSFPAPGVNEQVSSITHIIQLGDRFVISSLGSGVFIMNMDGVITETLARSSGLANESVPYIYLNSQDGDIGVLWIPTFSGISKLFPQHPIRIFSGRSGRPDFGGAQGGGSSQRNRTITGIQEYRRRLFVASSRGLSTLETTSRGPQFTPVEGMQNQPIQDLQLFRPEAGKEFLLASTNNTTFLIDRDLNLQNLNELLNLPSGNTGDRNNYFNTRLAQDPIRSNRLYMATGQITGWEYKNEKWTRLVNIEDLSLRPVMKLEVDQHGYLWASTFDGIKRIDISDAEQAEIKSYEPISSSSSNTRERTFLDPDSNEILVASSKGFFRYLFSDDTFQYDSLYNQVFPPGELQISSFQKDALGIFWYSFQSENNGWTHLGARKSGNRMEVVYEKPFRVLDDDPVEVFFRNRPDALWFSQSDRLYRFDISPDRTIDTSGYRTLIRSLVVNRDTLIYNGTSLHTSGTDNKQASLQHKNNNLQFTWSALYFDQEFRNRYSYKLEGFDDDWSGWGRSAEKEYTNLPAGSYTMRIRSQNIYGIDGQADKYAFSIAPPWYLAWWSITLYILLLTAIILLVLNYTRNLRRRTQILERKNSEIELQKKALEQLNDEITSQRDEIETQRDSMARQRDLINRQNNAMTDSIHYARRIQDAVLPAKDVMRYLLPKHFVFYRPRDIVSGDFYWIDKKDETVLLVVADCTGHGVPGAFMSMLGISLLNEISSSLTSHSTNEIMDELRDRVIDALGQTGDRYEARDGMEAGLLAINPKTREIQYTGANLNLYIFTRGKMIKVKGDQMPVGIHSEAGTPFTSQSLKLDRGDALYLFSDGFPDQFGGEYRKKFGTPRLKKLLTELQPRIMLDQRSALEEAFDKWKGSEEQIDDVLMVGIKL